MHDGPHVLPFVFTKDMYSAVVINLEGEARVIKGSRGSPMGLAREALGLNSDIAVSGICGCRRRHSKDVGKGAFVPFGATLVQTASVLPGRQAHTNSAYNIISGKESVQFCGPGTTN